MKAFVILLVALGVLGGSGYYIYELFYKPKIEIQQKREELASAPAPTPPPDLGLNAYNEALEIRKSGNLAEAKTAFTNIIRNHPQSSALEDVIDGLGEINITSLLQMQPGEHKSEYVVSSGDTLIGIASKYKTTTDLLIRMNNLDGIMLRIGDRLIVPDNQFSIRINRAAQIVDLYNHDIFFKRYRPVKMALPAPAAGSAPVQAQVTEKISWKRGDRVASGAKEYLGSTKWIQTSASGLVLFADDHGTGDVRTPTGGIQLSPADMDELVTLIPNRTEIIME